MNGRISTDYNDERFQRQDEEKRLQRTALTHFWGDRKRGWDVVQDIDGAVDVLLKASKQGRTDYRKSERTKSCKNIGALHSFECFTLVQRRKKAGARREAVYAAISLMRENRKLMLRPEQSSLEKDEAGTARNI